MTATIDRRVTSLCQHGGARFDACIVTESLVVQHLSGTMSAIEYLKANDVHGAIIERVLASFRVRRRDAEALADIGTLSASTSTSTSSFLAAMRVRCRAGVSAVASD